MLASDELEGRAPGSAGDAKARAYLIGELERIGCRPGAADGSWDLRGLAQDARLGFWAGLIVAMEDAMPAWSPGNEFEAARRAALASLPR